MLPLGRLHISLWPEGISEVIDITLEDDSGSLVIQMVTKPLQYKAFPKAAKELLETMTYHQPEDRTEVLKKL